MNPAKLVALGISLSIALMVFGIALKAGAGGARLSISDRALYLRSLAAMYLVMPTLAILIALYAELERPLLIALMLLALSPVPPVLPGKQMKAGGGADFVLGLFVVSAIVAMLAVPAGIEVIGRVFDRELDVPFAVTARVVATSVLLPAIAGLALARAAPAFSTRMADPLSKASSLLLVALLMPVVIMGWDRMVVHVGNYTILVIVLFVAAGLLTGHLLGGPRTEDRTALALATATRHPGVAIAVLHAAAPEARDVAPVVVLYLLVAAITSVPYLKWRQRAQRPSTAR